jgi:Zn-finger nucleic acid-binding protein
LKCPACSSTLNGLLQGAYVCNNAHGVLLSGKLLASRNESLVQQLEIYDKRSNFSEKNLDFMKCPNCNSIMTQVNYNHTGILIDSCVNCPYRWLDRGELRAIIAHKPEFKNKIPELLLAASRELNQKQPSEPNPAYRIRYGYAYTSVLGIAPTLIRGIMHSRFLGFTVLFLVIVFFLAYWIIWSSYGSDVQGGSGLLGHNSSQKHTFPRAE